MPSLRRVTLGIVVAGLAMAVLLGAARGFDAVALIILASLCVVGGLGVAVAYRAERGNVAPLRCPSCDGVVSPHAPYCKHCGARLTR